MWKRSVLPMKYSCGMGDCGSLSENSYTDAKKKFFHPQMARIVRIKS